MLEQLCRQLTGNELLLVSHRQTGWTGPREGAGGKVGERRRVGASCMVDGYTNVAGGGQYRRSKGERMRFKVLHKIYDFKKRFGYQMCVGCGRCDMICPEYISFSACINKVNQAVQEEAAAAAAKAAQN